MAERPAKKKAVRIDELPYLEARKLLLEHEAAKAQRVAHAAKESQPESSKRPSYSFPKEVRIDLEKVLSKHAPKDDPTWMPTVIAHLERIVAPGGFIPGPIFSYVRRRTKVKKGQWAKLARVLRDLVAALDSLDYDAGADIDTGADGGWEYEHNCDPPDIDLWLFGAEAERIAAMVAWLNRHPAEKRRGRPVQVSEDRRMLGQAVGLRLHWSGIRLTKSRDGTLAKTLDIIFMVAELGAPTDMFAVTKAVVLDVEWRLARIAKKRDEDHDVALAEDAARSESARTKGASA